MSLKSRQREIVIARVEMQWSIADIEKRFGFPTLQAARMAVIARSSVSPRGCRPFPAPEGRMGILLVAIAPASHAAGTRRGSGAGDRRRCGRHSPLTSPGILVDSSITVSNVETGIERTAVTDGSGRYQVPALPPGTYNISAALPGFTTRTLENVVLALGQAVTIDFQLRVAGITEAATVAGEILPVQVSRTEMSSVINQAQVDALPTNGRNFISFAVITPGVTTDRTPQQGAIDHSGLSFAGQRARSNNIMVDGLDNNDQVVGAVGPRSARRRSASSRC